MKTRGDTEPGSYDGVWRGFFRLLVAVFLFAFTWMVSTTNVLAHDNRYDGGTRGNDISYPQCSSDSSPQNAFGIVGVTGGRAFTKNRCLSEEFAWADALAADASLYMNLNAPNGSTASLGKTGPYGACTQSDTLCQAANYGYGAAQFAYTYAQQQGVSASHWWLDIEFANHWSSDTAFNRHIIDAAAQFFSDKGIDLGIYSTPRMWDSITGGYQNSLPVWFATVSTSPARYCSSSYSFTGGDIYLVQYSNPDEDVDSDYACP